MRTNVAISVLVNETTHRNFKAAVALKGESMQELLRSFIVFYTEAVTCEMAHRMFE